MRTTITLEPDVVDLLRREAAQQHVSFKDAVNSAIRQGLSTRAEAEAYEVPTFDLGTPVVPLTAALRLAADLEDDAIIRKMDVGK